MFPSLSGVMFLEKKNKLKEIDLDILEFFKILGIVEHSIKL